MKLLDQLWASVILTFAPRYSASARVPPCRLRHSDCPTLSPGDQFVSPLYSGKWPEIRSCCASSSSAPRCSCGRCRRPRISDSALSASSTAYSAGLCFYLSDPWLAAVPAVHQFAGCSTRAGPASRRRSPVRDMLPLIPCSA